VCGCARGLESDMPGHVGVGEEGGALAVSRRCTSAREGKVSWAVGHLRVLLGLHALLSGLDEHPPRLAVAAARLRGSGVQSSTGDDGG
jgi:hypothetical protein